MWQDWVFFWQLITPYHNWFDWTAAASSLFAAFFWLRASLVKMPGGPIHLVHPHFEVAIMEVTSRQSRLNAWAAGFAALAAFISALGMGTAKFW